MKREEKPLLYFFNNCQRINRRGKKWQLKRKYDFNEKYHSSPGKYIDEIQTRLSNELKSTFFKKFIR